MGDFTPKDIFSCSAECAALARSCPACARSARHTSAWFPASPVLLPRLSLRDAYSMFISAVRERLIDNICNLNRDNGTGMNAKALHAIRFGQGFLTMEECIDSLWGYGWERRSQAR